MLLVGLKPWSATWARATADQLVDVLRELLHDKVPDKYLGLLSLELLQISSSDLFDIQKKKQFSRLSTNPERKKNILQLVSIYVLDT